MKSIVATVLSFVWALVSQAFARFLVGNLDRIIEALVLVSERLEAYAAKHTAAGEAAVAEAEAALDRASSAYAARDRALAVRERVNAILG